MVLQIVTEYLHALDRGQVEYAVYWLGHMRAMTMTMKPSQMEPE